MAGGMLIFEELAESTLQHVTDQKGRWVRGVDAYKQQLRSTPALVR